jgi:magnesium-transporting ATPase (P-type)
MNRLTTSLALYLSAYAPIYAIFALQITISWVIATATALAVLGILATFWLRQKHRRDTAKATDDGRTIASVERFTMYKILGYMVPAILAFVIPETQSANDLAAYAFFLTLCAIMYLRTDLIAVNPTLMAIGLRITPVATDASHQVYVLSRANPTQGQPLAPALLTHPSQFPP